MYGIGGLLNFAFLMALKLAKKGGSTKHTPKVLLCFNLV